MRLVIVLFFDCCERPHVAKIQHCRARGSKSFHAHINSQFLQWRMRDSLRVCLRAFALTIISYAASFLIDRFLSHRFQIFVGVTSPLFPNPSLILRCFRVVSVFLFGLSPFYLVLMNPLFLVHLSQSGFDSLFIAPMALVLNTRHSYFGTLLISLARQFVVPPDPSLSLLWLIDSHYLSLFRIPARITISLFQALSLFLSRHWPCHILPLVISAVFDPCADWASLALLTTAILPLANTHPRVNAAILLIASGFVFAQSAFVAWWGMGTGNANFAMVGCLIYTVGLIVLIAHFVP
jgi:hypothetical protein